MWSGNHSGDPITFLYRATMRSNVYFVQYFGLCDSEMSLAIRGCM